jgi:hypothetical protein
MLSEFQKDKLRDVLSDPNVHATTMLAVLLDNFGTDAINADPEVIADSLNNLVGYTIPSKNLDKLQAIVATLATNQFLVSPRVFHAITNALNGSGSETDVFDPVTPEEINWALTEVMLNSFDKDQSQNLDSMFSPSVKRYINEIYRLDGITLAPEPVKHLLVPTGNIEDVEPFPELAPAINQIAQEKSDEIKVYTVNHAARLIDELTSLPLQNAQPQAKERLVKALSNLL